MRASVSVCLCGCTRPLHVLNPSPLPKNTPQNINPDDVWKNIGILSLMAPCYLVLAYLFLRSLKKKT